MKKILLHLLLLFPMFPVIAQESSDEPSVNKLNEYMDAGMEVADLRVPYYNEKGERQAWLYGGVVTMMEGQIARVTNLRIDVYKDDDVVMTLFAPQCFAKLNNSTDNRFLEAYSEGEVLIDMEQMTISGRGFKFTTEENKFEIQHDSKVIVKESAREIKGVEL